MTTLLVVLLVACSAFEMPVPSAEDVLLPCGEKLVSYQQLTHSWNVQTLTRPMQEGEDAWVYTIRTPHNDHAPVIRVVESLCAK